MELAHLTAVFDKEGCPIEVSPHDSAEHAAKYAAEVASNAQAKNLGLTTQVLTPVDVTQVFPNGGMFACRACHDRA